MTLPRTLADEATDRRVVLAGAHTARLPYAELRSSARRKAVPWSWSFVLAGLPARAVVAALPAENRVA